jgi:hypothetical protein
MLSWGFCLQTFVIRVLTVNRTPHAIDRLRTRKITDLYNLTMCALESRRSGTIFQSEQKSLSLEYVLPQFIGNITVCYYGYLTTTQSTVFVQKLTICQPRNFPPFTEPKFPYNSVYRSPPLTLHIQFDPTNNVDLICVKSMPQTSSFA